MTRVTNAKPIQIIIKYITKSDPSLFREENKSGHQAVVLEAFSPLQFSLCSVSSSTRM